MKGARNGGGMDFRLCEDEKKLIASLLPKEADIPKREQKDLQDFLCLCCSTYKEEKGIDRIRKAEEGEFKFFLAHILGMVPDEEFEKRFGGKPQ